MTKFQWCLDRAETLNFKEYRNSKRLAIIGNKKYQSELENKITNNEQTIMPETIPTLNTESKYKSPTEEGYQNLLGEVKGEQGFFLL